MAMLGARTKFANGYPVPGPITGYGGGTFGLDGTQMTPDTRGILLGEPPLLGGQVERDPMMSPEPQKHSGGLFGVNDPTAPISPLKTAIAAFLGGIGGGPNVAIQMLQQRQQNAAEDQRYERRRQQQLQDQKDLYSWKAQNPDDDFSQTLRAAGIMPGTPAYQSMMMRRATNLTDPPHMVSMPGGGSMLVGGNYGYPGQQPKVEAGPTVGAIEDGYRFKGGNPSDPSAWEPVGGAATTAGGPFPR